MGDHDTGRRRRVARWALVATLAAVAAVAWRGRTLPDRDPRPAQGG